MSRPRLQPITQLRLLGEDEVAKADGYNATGLHGPAGAFAWCPNSLRRLLAAGLSEADLCSLLSDRVITTSSAFSGAGADLVADSSTEATARKFLPGSSCGSEARPLRFKAVHAIERNGPCQEELLHYNHAPSCLFGDIMAFCPPAVQHLCEAAHHWEPIRFASNHLSIVVDSDRPAGSPN